MKRRSELKVALLVLLLSAVLSVVLVATSGSDENGDAWWLAAWWTTFLIPLVFLDWRRSACDEWRCLRRKWRALRGG